MSALVLAALVGLLDPWVTCDVSSVCEASGESSDASESPELDYRPSMLTLLAMDAAEKRASRLNTLDAVQSAR